MTTTTKFSSKISLWVLCMSSVAALYGRAAIAGPFGLEMGMTLEQAGPNLKQIAPGKYKTTVVPKPHSAFESYILEIGPRSGLCWIKAIGKNVSTSQFGLETACRL